MRKRLVVLVLAAAAGGAIAQTKPAPEHFTAPGLPGEANKDIVGRPSGALKDVGWGYVQQGDPAARRVRVAPPNPGSPDADPGFVPSTRPSRPAGPLGPAVVDAAYATVRGSVVRVEKGVAITLVDARTGKERRVPLAKGASVYEGIREGDAVVLRIPFGEGSDARSADRVEPQKTPATAPPASKFSQAQARAPR